MKNVQIIHNPTAGKAEHNKQDLIDFFRGSGDVVNYVSTDDEDWEEFSVHQPDLIVIAGGDGTIRKLAAILLKKGSPHKKLPPIRLLPLGTANNISETLEIQSQSSFSEIRPERGRKNFDCGRVKGLKDQEFFLESIGFGIFPELIFETEKKDMEKDDPEEELAQVLRVLLEIVKKFKAREAKIKADGIRIKGSFLMVELMNIKFIGPNLPMAPNADPGDGYFDLIMIPENCRAELIAYLEKRIENKKQPLDTAKFVKIIRAKKVRMKWKASKAHLDDVLINNYSEKKIKVKMLSRVFQFIQ